LIESRGNLSGPEVLWLIIRRNLDDQSVIKFYISNAQVETPLTELVSISGTRWPIKIIFEEDKVEIGLDHYYETRSWLGGITYVLGRAGRSFPGAPAGSFS
jgi:SRSO17 transposase